MTVKALARVKGLGHCHGSAVMLQSYCFVWWRIS